MLTEFFKEAYEADAMDLANIDERTRVLHEVILNAYFESTWIRNSRTGNKKQGL